MEKFCHCHGVIPQHGWISIGGSMGSDPAARNATFLVVCDDVSAPICDTSRWLAGHTESLRVDLREALCSLSMFAAAALGGGRSQKLSLFQRWGCCCYNFLRFVQQDTLSGVWRIWHRDGTWPGLTMINHDHSHDDTFRCDKLRYLKSFLSNCYPFGSRLVVSGKVLSTLGPRSNSFWSQSHAVMTGTVQYAVAGKWKAFQKTSEVLFHISRKFQMGICIGACTRNSPKATIILLM